MAKIVQRRQTSFSAPRTGGGRGFWGESSRFSGRLSQLRQGKRRACRRRSHAPELIDLSDVRDAHHHLTPAARTASAMRASAIIMVMRRCKRVRYHARARSARYLFVQGWAFPGQSGFTSWTGGVTIQKKHPKMRHGNCGHNHCRGCTKGIPFRRNAN